MEDINNTIPNKRKLNEVSTNRDSIKSIVEIYAAFSADQIFGTLDEDRNSRIFHRLLERCRKVYDRRSVSSNDKKDLKDLIRFLTMVDLLTSMYFELEKYCVDTYDNKLIVTQSKPEDVQVFTKFLKELSSIVNGFEDDHI